MVASSLKSEYAIGWELIKIIVEIVEILPKKTDLHIKNAFNFILDM